MMFPSFFILFWKVEIMGLYDGEKPKDSTNMQLDTAPPS